MPRVEVDIDINRGIDDTFKYLLHLDNMQEWQKEIKNVIVLSIGDVKEGTKFYRSLKFLNVELEEYYLVDKLVKNECIEMNTYKSAFPFFLAFYVKKIASGVTNVKVVIEGDPKYYFMKFATPILVNITRKAMNKGLENLKQILESQTIESISLNENKMI